MNGTIEERDLSCIDELVVKLHEHLNSDSLRFKMTLFMGLVAVYKIKEAESTGVPALMSDVIGESLFQWIKDERGI